jgi:hypothetical protein
LLASPQIVANATFIRGGGFVGVKYAESLRDEMPPEPD